MNIIIIKYIIYGIRYTIFKKRFKLIWPYETRNILRTDTSNCCIINEMRKNRTIEETTEDATIDKKHE